MPLEHVTDHCRVPIPVVLGVARAVHPDEPLSGTNEPLEHGLLPGTLLPKPVPVFPRIELAEAE